MTRRDVSDRDRQLLLELVGLSHIYGGPDYVRAGGGNTSVKVDGILYVKPSGLPLAAVEMEQLVAVDRARLSKVYQLSEDLPPSQTQARISQLIADSVVSGGKGRPSVETPLHDSLQWRFVVHTHPALVNGMTCSMNGREYCDRLFPEALWMDYVDPGLALCMEMRQAVQDYQLKKGQQPSLIFLQNHGLVVGADTPTKIHRLHAQVMDTLVGFYKQVGVSLRINQQKPDQDVVRSATVTIQQAFGYRAAVEVEAGFTCAQGPLTPDHIVYARSYTLEEVPTTEALARYRRRFGYDPRVVSWGGLVCSVGKDLMEAKVALELAGDGALVRHLAEAFGGVRYMSEQARLFIEGWEAEAYRLKVLQSQSS